MLDPLRVTHHSTTDYPVPVPGCGSAGGHELRPAQGSHFAFSRSLARQSILAALLHSCQTEPMDTRVTINSRGVITIPASVRQAYGLKPNDELIVQETEQGILLRPAVSVPIEIYTDERIREFAEDEPAIQTLLPADEARSDKDPETRDG